MQGVSSVQFTVLSVRFTVLQIHLLLLGLGMMRSDGTSKWYRVYQNNKLYRKRERNVQLSNGTAKYFYVTAETALLVLLINLGRPIAFCDMQATMVDSEQCLDRVVPEGMSQVSRRSEVGNHKLRSFNTSLTLVAGPIFETKNREIFLERFFGRGISGDALLPLQLCSH